MKKVTIFDSTLRDGAQAEGVSFSVEDKIKIVKALDELGVGYIEAGNPGSNPKDLDFLKELSLLTLKILLLLPSEVQDDVVFHLQKTEICRHF